MLITNHTNYVWTIIKEIRMQADISLNNNLPGSEALLPADHSMYVNAISAGFTDLGSYTQSMGKNTVIDGKLNFSYNKKFGIHTVMTSIGFTGQSTTGNSTSIQVS